ncbi:MAG: sigma 54-interacting transcriptional regulator [Kofleriaceae bacterium]
MSDTLSAIVSTARKGRGKPALFIGISGDAPRSPPARISLAAVDKVIIGRTEARKIERRKADGAELVVLGLADGRMSTQHARISRLGGAWIIEDLTSKNGTWIGTARVTRKQLEDGDAIVVGHTVLVYRDDGGEEPDLDGVPPPAAPGLTTLSPLLADRYRELVAAARSPNLAVEINGETGTGKELAANAVHVASGRTGAFVAVNCGAILETMIEAELFGHKKHAFTGATEDRTGRIRSADGGTLFLDEIGELPLASQPALLRALQEHEVVPVGSDRPIKVDIRLVTATNRDLDAEVEAGRFRADLRARLLGKTVTLPPLRHRLEDLALLVATLLDRLAPGRAVTFSADALSALYIHDWPLNVRELERALIAALAVAQDRIEGHHLPAAVGATEPLAPSVFREVAPEEKLLRDQLVAAISRHKGNLAGVAREMGKDRTQIRRWMKRFGIAREDVTD